MWIEGLDLIIFLAIRSEGFRSFESEKKVKKMTLDNYSLMKILRSRQRLLEEYNLKGFSRFSKVVKKAKKKKEIKHWSVDDLYEIVLMNFENVVDGMFFVFYFIVEFSDENLVLQTRYPSFVFYEVFDGLVDFILFEEMDCLCLINYKDEVRLKKSIFALF